MSVLYVALPVALLLAIAAVVAFVYQARSGQFDDLETPPRRILFDDQEASPDRDVR
ncbi:MAG: cbb3-type cytochrome oxidase assembly protein CcoS [Pirellulaceae bacterium]